MTSKERLLNDKQSIEKEIFTCMHVIQDNSAVMEYILKL